MPLTIPSIKQRRLKPEDSTQSNKRRLSPKPTYNNKRMDSKLMSSPLYPNVFEHNKENLVQTSPIKKDLTYSSRQLLASIETPKPVLKGNDSSVNKYLIFSDKDSIHNNSIHLDDNATGADEVEVESQARPVIQTIATQAYDSGDDEDLLAPFDDLVDEPTVKFLNEKSYNQDYVDNLKVSYDGQISGLKEQVSSMRSELLNNQQKVHQLESERIAFASERDAFESERNEFKIKSGEFEREMKNSDTTNAKLQKNIKILEAKNQALEKQVLESKTQVKHLHETQTQLTDTNSQLEEKLQVQEQDIEKLHKENNRLNNRSNDLCTEAEGLKVELSNQLRVVESTNEELTKAKIEIEERQGSLADMQSTVESAIVESKRLESLNIEYKQEVDELVEQASEKDQQLIEKDQQLDQKDQQLAEVIKATEELRVSETNVRLENNKLIEELNFKNQETDRLTNELNVKNQETIDLAQQLRNLSLDKKQVDDKLQKLTYDKQEVDHQLQQQLLKIQNVQSQLTQLNSENNELHNQNNKLDETTRSISSITNQITQLQAENERLQHSAEKYNKHKYAKVVREYFKLKDAWEVLNSEKVVLQQKNNELEVKYYSMESTVDIIQQEMDAIREAELH